MVVRFKNLRKIELHFERMFTATDLSGDIHAGQIITGVRLCIATCLCLGHDFGEHTVVLAKVIEDE